MTDTTDTEQVELEQAEPTEPEPTLFERLVEAGRDLSFIGDAQRIGVARCVDPEDFNNGGVAAQLANYAEHVVIYDGTAKASEPIAIVPLASVGDPDSLAFKRASKLVWLDDGALSHDMANGFVVAPDPKAIKSTEAETQRRNMRKLSAGRARAERNGEPAAIIAAYDAEIKTLS